MHIDIHVSLYAYAAANGAAVLCAIKSDLRGRAWREGKEEGERFISKSLINSATCKVRVTKIKGKTKEKGTTYIHVSFLHSMARKNGIVLFAYRDKGGLLWKTIHKRAGKACT